MRVGSEESMNPISYAAVMLRLKLGSDSVETMAKEWETDKKVLIVENFVSICWFTFICWSSEGQRGRDIFFHNSSMFISTVFT